MDVLIKIIESHHYIKVVIHRVFWFFLIKITRASIYCLCNLVSTRCGGGEVPITFQSWLTGRETTPILTETYIKSSFPPGNLDTTCIDFPTNSLFIYWQNLTADVWLYGGYSLQIHQTCFFVPKTRIRSTIGFNWVETLRSKIK